MARDATTIYIDDSSVRVLTISGRHPQKWASAELESGLVRDGLILHPEEVARVVRKVWSQGFSGSRVVAGLSGVNCLYRTLVLPSLPRDLLPEAVRRESGRALGVSMEQLYVSWQPVPTLLEETRVFLAAAPRDAVDALLATLRTSGLNPYLVDIRPLALARAVAQESAIVLDIQESCLDVVIKIDKVPEVMRSVPLGRTRSLEDSVKLGRQEIERAVSFYNSVHMDTPLQEQVPLLLSGLVSTKPELWKELEGRHPRNIEAIEPPIDVVQDFDAQSFSTNIGLAFKETAEKSGTGYSTINLNALPEKFKPKPRPLSELLYPPVLVVCALAVAFGGYMAINTHAHASALQAEWNALNEMTVSVGAQGSAEIQRLQDEISALQVEVEESEARSDALDSQQRLVSERRDDVNLDLGQLNDTPPGIDLDRVKYQEDLVVVSGWGDGEEAVFTYARALREGGHFHTVTITRLNKEAVRMAFEFVLQNKPPTQ